MEKQPTPIQQLINELEIMMSNANEQAKIFKRERLIHSKVTSEAMAVAYKFSIDTLKNILEKEKKVIIDAWVDGMNNSDFGNSKLPEDYYNEKFQNK
ncbi:MAG: hypothetical protein IPJ01_11410 [Micavibrio sp.]|nr:hypothetical protein [Micavibrio sp.]